MRGCYTASFKISAITAAQTLAYLTAPAGKVVEIIAVTVTNESNSTGFQGEVALGDITTLGTPTGYSAYTPQKMEPGDQAAGTTINVGSNTSTEPTTYASPNRIQEGYNSLLGWQYPLTNRDEERVYIAAGASMGIRLPKAPAASTDYDVRILIREIG